MLWNWYTVWLPNALLIFAMFRSQDKLLHQKNDRIANNNLQLANILPQHFTVADSDKCKLFFTGFFPLF